MKTTTTAPKYQGFRFPPEIISHCVWLYFRFSLSFRDLEEIMAERGVVLTYETLRQWCLKFGQLFAKELKKRRSKTGDPPLNRFRVRRMRLHLIPSPLRWFLV